MDPLQKALVDLWGLPGVLLAALGAFAFWLLKWIREVQEARIKEALDLAEKYGSRLQEQTASLRELTAVVHDAITRMVK